ncbi:MAG: LysR family transcriptional regulator, partial [Stenotrophomonas maltophilia]|nr:LysR family transcriptional regulator [Stenotrophomonas maltophilia]
VGLFHRTTRSVALTEAGQRLLERLQPALGQVNDALEEMNQFRAAPAGLLRINATRAAVPTQLGPRLARFLHAHPDVRVELTENDGLVDIVAEGYDAGVRLHEFVPEDMVAVPMGPPLRGLIVGSPDYLRRRPAPQHPRDLATHECIRFRFASGHLYKWQFERGGQALEIDVPGRLTLCEQGTVVRAVLDGIGLAYVLEDTARPYIESGQMVAVLEDWSEPFAGFALYYPKQRQMPGALRAFVDMLRE